MVIFFQAVVSFRANLKKRKLFSFLKKEKKTIEKRFKCLFQNQRFSVAYSKGHKAPMFYYYYYYYYFSRGTSYERRARINFGTGSLDWKLDVLFLFLRVKGN